MKLSAEMRALAIKAIKAGSTNKEVSEKFGITASAVCYLRKKAEGTSAELKEFECVFSKYQQDRIKTLVNAGLSVTEIAQDYEVSRTAIKDFLSKSGITKDKPKAQKKIIPTRKKAAKPKAKGLLPPGFFKGK
jgi:predicted DNA-binding protein YlxM (UPF0122 family)